jgi:hypothetical protein
VRNDSKNEMKNHPRNILKNEMKMLEAKSGQNFLIKCPKISDGGLG